MSHPCLTSISAHPIKSTNFPEEPQFEKIFVVHLNKQELAEELFGKLGS
jgi:hypothetical protein